MSFLFLALVLNLAHASKPELFGRMPVKYQTRFGQCPTKSSGMLSVLVMKEFEKNHSLKDVKEKIINEKLDEKYFLSDYKINYNPVTSTLRIQLECPEPMAKIQIYKANGDEHYSAILGDNAKMYEPHYENLLKAEKKLTQGLPLLAISSDQLDGDAPKALASFLKQMQPEIRKEVSELILSKNNDLTIVLALNRRATSVFMGPDHWEEKLMKLTKIVSYVTKSSRYPSSINLVNAKKVVVKFSDSL
jgi:Cell division protein FtsQ